MGHCKRLDFITYKAHDQKTIKSPKSKKIAIILKILKLVVSELKQLIIKPNIFLQYTYIHTYIWGGGVVWCKVHMGALKIKLGPTLKISALHSEATNSRIFKDFSSWNSLISCLGMESANYLMLVPILFLFDSFSHKVCIRTCPLTQPFGWIYRKPELSSGSTHVVLYSKLVINIILKEDNACCVTIGDIS